MCWLLAACANTSSQTHAAAPTDRCLPGTHNYGDGMVAALLPQNAEAALNEAHARAVSAAGSRRASSLADPPWRPHISVIYGITDDRAVPVTRALQAFTATHQGASSCFGGLHYWDDARGNKTTLVVDVIEHAGALTSLHNALAQAASIASRFAYHPHVTLLYLTAQARLGPEQEAAVKAPLRGVCWVNQSFELTDPCGQTRVRAHLRAPDT